MRKGWLKIPGVQDGDRTLEEQIVAVRPALTEAAGKTVLDLGCAEGLISLEFSKAGASYVLGIDCVEDHLRVARQQCDGHNVNFKKMHLFKVNPDTPAGFDIVLALGIVHKMQFPERLMRFAARSARELLLLRNSAASRNGIIRSKHYQENFCDSRAILTEEGFALEKIVDGPKERGEDVEYWRKA